MQRLSFFLSIQLLAALFIYLSGPTAYADVSVCATQCKGLDSSMYSNCVNNCYSGAKTTNTSAEQECYNTCMANELDDGHGYCTNFCSGKQSTASTSACEAQIQSLLSTCTGSTASAMNSCDDSQNTGIAQAQQAAVGIGSVVSQSVAAACSAMGKVSQTANAAVAAYQMNCSSSVDTCKTDCSAALNYYNQNKATCAAGGTPSENLQSLLSQITVQQKACGGLTAKVQQAQQALNNFMATTVQAQNCNSLTSGTSSVTTELCLQNPSLVGCSAINMDCSNPAMASNKVCVCSKNPNDPSCLATQSASNMTTSASTTPGVSASNASTDGFGGDLNGTPEIAQGKMPTPGNDPGVDGKQGAGAALGGNSAGDGGSAAKKGGTAGDPAGEVGVNAGFYGAGGGGSFGGSGGGGSGDPLARYAMATGAAGKKDGVNLRQFLPGGNMDPRSRGLAGISGPDGITGPHSDIWQKIQNRYQVVGPSLMP